MFYVSVLSALFALSHAIQAAPSIDNHDGGTPQNRRDITAKYDDVLTPPVVLLPLTNYMGLTYNSFVVLAQPATGPRPQSGSDMVAYGIRGEILTGTPSISIANGYFDLISFYYAWQLNDQGTPAGIPEPCTFIISGYRGSQYLGSQNYSYNPTTLTPPMNFAKAPPSFRGLTKVTFETLNGTLLGTLFDNVRYVTYTVKN